MNALKLKDIRLWAAAKPAFELRLSALPPKLARLHWFAAICELEQAEAADQWQRLYKTNVLQVIAITLGLPEVQGVYPIAAVDGEVQLLMHKEHGKWRSGGSRISEEELDGLRKKICRLDDFTLPDETENPQLVAASKRVRRLYNPDIFVNVDDLCAAMALQAGCPPEEVWDWPMKKFNTMSRAVTRMEQYRASLVLKSTGFAKHTDGCEEVFWLMDMKPKMPEGVSPVSELNKNAQGLI